MTDIIIKRNIHLRGLQLVHRNVLEILEDISHLALYEFIPTDKQWKKLDIEGSAYITRNSCTPFYSLIVVNKKGSEDFIVNICEQIQKVKLQDEYLMLRCNLFAEDNLTISIGVKVYGLWIGDESARKKFGDEIDR
jgi:hypothetical protein